MTTPHPSSSRPLFSDADAQHRVEQLVGRATAVRKLWIMFVDGDGRQSPVVVPVADLPQQPRNGPLDGLAKILAGLRGELATDLGPGSVILTLERLGDDAVLPADREWAAALIAVCHRAGTDIRGLFLSTDSGVRALGPPAVRDSTGGCI